MLLKVFGNSGPVAQESWVVRDAKGNKRYFSSEEEALKLGAYPIHIKVHGGLEQKMEWLNYT